MLLTDKQLDCKTHGEKDGRGRTYPIIISSCQKHRAHWYIPVKQIQSWKMHICFVFCSPLLWNHKQPSAPKDHLLGMWKKCYSKDKREHKVPETGAGGSLFHLIVAATAQNTQGVRDRGSERGSPFNFNSNCHQYKTNMVSETGEGGSPFHLTAAAISTKHSGWQIVLYL